MNWDFFGWGIIVGLLGMGGILVLLAKIIPGSWWAKELKGVQRDIGELQYKFLNLNIPKYEHPGQVLNVWQCLEAMRRILRHGSFVLYRGDQLVIEGRGGVWTVVEVDPDKGEAGIFGITDGTFFRKFEGEDILKQGNFRIVFLSGSIEGKDTP